MTVTIDEMSTEVRFLPYVKSGIDDGYIQSNGKQMIVSSVNGHGNNYRDDLVMIMLPSGGSAVVSAAAMITAIQKCVR